MSNDLVERLKDHGLFNKAERMALFKEAWIEIERLREENKRLKAQTVVRNFNSNSFM